MPLHEILRINNVFSVSFSFLAFPFNPLRIKSIKGAHCKVFIKWASLIGINWIKFGLIK